MGKGSVRLGENTGLPTNGALGEVICFVGLIDCLFSSVLVRKWIVCTCIRIRCCRRSRPRSTPGWAFWAGGPSSSRTTTAGPRGRRATPNGRRRPRRWRARNPPRDSLEKKKTSPETETNKQTNKQRNKRWVLCRLSYNRRRLPSRHRLWMVWSTFSCCGSKDTFPRNKRINNQIKHGSAFDVNGNGWSIGRTR